MSTLIEDEEGGVSAAAAALFYSSVAVVLCCLPSGEFAQYLSSKLVVSLSSTLSKWNGVVFNKVLVVISIERRAPPPPPAPHRVCLQ